MEWRGSSLLLVEGIDELIRYGREEILLGAEGQTISVRGKDLEMKFLTSDRIAVEGTLEAVSYV